MSFAHKSGSGLVDNLRISLAVVALLWIVFVLDLLLPPDWRAWGIRPRHVGSLWRMAVSPLLHLNLNHIIANSSALFPLLLVSLSVSRKLTGLAAVMIVLFSGLGIWAFGKPYTIHIGASGVVFGLIGFLLFAGIFRREIVPLLASLVVLFFYGGAMWALFRFTPGVSWAGHFWGFGGGIVAAWITRRERRT
ncbi:MAG: rhomboid family intramembrane serine protease [Desulfatibacillaceae bacterium]